MEIKTLRYFLAVAREENMTRAAEMLHVTQPTLSKQLRALEEELGKKLFLRRSFSIQLTEEGILLRKRAQDLVNMADKIANEFISLDDVTGGDVYFGLAESYQIRYLAAAINSFKKAYPTLRYHITSGDTEQVIERLNKGVIDFAVLVEEPDAAKYNYLTFPEADIWGVVMPKNCPLARKEVIRAEDLTGLPLFCSEQGWQKDIPRWCGSLMDKLHLEGSFRLSYNASLFVKEGLGYLLTFQHLIDARPGSGLVFRPLSPKLDAALYLIWKKQQAFTPIAERLLHHLQAEFLSAPLP
ncbi:MAG: LysR family transcriptional regulator [Bacillus sp. (in: Bacteria)]|nr:LysR family transcriptional regulator [Bacillus sp. (in: firmicutes)]MCM1426508.1 LysR family transcriptional regulator [Eubacterium sp.]